MAILSVSNLKKTYTTRFGGSQVQALKNINFSVDNGEYVAVMGESGSGKSTTAYNVIGMEEMTGGKIIFKGRDISMPLSKRTLDMKKEIQINEGIV